MGLKQETLDLKAAMAELAQAANSTGIELKTPPREQKKASPTTAAAKPAPPTSR